MNRNFQVCILETDKCSLLIASLFTKTMKDAQFIASLFPKHDQVGARHNYGAEHKGRVTLTVLLGKRKETGLMRIAEGETGLKRIACFLKHCKRLGYTYDTTIEDLLEKESVSQ